MAQPEQDNITKLLDYVGRTVDKITAGAHNAPEAGAKGIATVPSRHRLYNAAGGIGLWIVGRQIMNIMVGETPSGKKIEKDDVNPALRQLHGILAYNRYADDPHNQWMRVIDDLTPAIIGSIGAVLGSKYFFSAKEAGYLKAVGWGSKHTEMKSMLADKTIPSLAKENFVALQQAKTWRILSGISGVFAASSGMALLVAPFNILNYGVGLNNAFAMANGVIPGSNLFKNTPLLKWIYNTQSSTSNNPGLAARAIVNNVSNCVAEMESMGKLITADGVKTENFARINILSDAIIHKLFPKVTEKGAQRFKKSVMDAIDNAVAKAGSAHEPQKVSNYVKEELDKLLTKGRGLDDTIEKLSKEIGKENFGDVTFGNHGFVGWLGNRPKSAYGAAAAGMLGINSVGEIASRQFVSQAKKNISATAREDIGDPNSVAPSLSAPAESSPGFINGPLLNAGRWLSDSVVNVPPQNRLFSALGLTGGLWAGYRGMRALAGKEFNGQLLGKDAKIGPVFKWGADTLKSLGVKLDFKYFINTPHDRLKRSVFWLVPTLTGIAGTYLGSMYAFRKQRKQLQNPEYLEDYTAKVALKQGDQWGFLLSTAAVMASASGFSNLPIPGINYSISLSSRTILSYDKKNTMPGMGWWSNNKSDYYFGLKGALDYTILYALRNPSEYPKELAALAEATLKPIFPDVSNDQVAQYVNKIQAVRHKYWQEKIGIPANKITAAETELKSILRGTGFEKTLEELGLDPTKAVFDNGVSGTIANSIGAKKHVLKLEKEYRLKAQARHEERQRSSPPTEEPSPYEAPEKSFAESVTKKSALIPAATHAEAAAKSASAQQAGIA